MSYQLPAELQTKKLNSLPEKERAIADELIANKFGIGEVVSEGRYENRDRFQDPFSLPNNLLQLTVFFSRGYQFRLHLPLGISMLSHEPVGTSATYYGNSVGDYDNRRADLAYEVVRKIEDQLRRYLSSSEGQGRGSIKYIEVEINGYRQIISSLDEIHRLIFERMV